MQFKMFVMQTHNSLLCRITYLCYGHPKPLLCRALCWRSENVPDSRLLFKENKVPRSIFKLVKHCINPSLDYKITRLKSFKWDPFLMDKILWLALNFMQIQDRFYPMEGPLWYAVWKCPLIHTQRDKMSLQRGKLLHF